MNENEFYSELKKRNLSLEDACEMMYGRTQVYIRPCHIRTRFDRFRTLSKAMEIAFKFFFMVLDNGTI